MAFAAFLPYQAVLSDERFTSQGEHYLRHIMDNFLTQLTTMLLKVGVSKQTLYALYEKMRDRVVEYASHVPQGNTENKPVLTLRALANIVRNWDSVDAGTKLRLALLLTVEMTASIRAFHESFRKIEIVS